MNQIPHRGGEKRYGANTRSSTASLRSSMEKEYTKMGTIRGTRYAVELTKRVKGIPGFAPEYRDIKVCEVVFKFPHSDGETYVDFEENPPILDTADIEQILEVINEPFIEEKFEFSKNN